MKRFFKKLVVRLYWKLRCHTVDSYADQFTLWVLPGKVRKKELAVFVAELNRITKANISKFDMWQPFEPKAARTFPDKVKIDVKDLKP